MPLAPWKPLLARALHRNRSQPQSRYLQLATVSHDGRPANRTVVFRGFSEPDDTLLMVTDQRSQKISHITHQPWAEACWYFAKTREQFRLAGRITCFDWTAEGTGQDLRCRTWAALSEAARRQFSWPTPAQPRSPESAFEKQEIDLHSPLTHFCVLSLTPNRVDHLELRSQTRCLYQYPCDQPEATWTITPVNP
jgi:PPOX class probable FMN-dependent enzyme